MSMTINDMLLPHLHLMIMSSSNDNIHDSHHGHEQGPGGWCVGRNAGDEAARWEYHVFAAHCQVQFLSEKAMFSSSLTGAIFFWHDGMVNGFYKGTIADIGREGEENIAPEGLCGFFVWEDLKLVKSSLSLFSPIFVSFRVLVHASVLLFWMNQNCPVSNSTWSGPDGWNMLCTAFQLLEYQLWWAGGWVWYSREIELLPPCTEEPPL